MGWGSAQPLNSRLQAHAFQISRLVKTAFTGQWGLGARSEPTRQEHLGRLSGDGSWGVHALRSGYGRPMGGVRAEGGMVFGLRQWPVALVLRRAAHLNARRRAATRQRCLRGHHSPFQKGRFWEGRCSARTLGSVRGPRRPRLKEFQQRSGPCLPACMHCQPAAAQPPNHCLYALASLRRE